MPVISADVLFSTSGPTPGSNLVSVHASTSLYLAAADGAPLTNGAFEDAIYPLTPAHPAAFVPLGCPDTAGTFTIHEVQYDPDGTLAVLAVDYDVWCTGMWNMESRGAIRFHSSFPVKAVLSTPESLELGAVSTADTASGTVTVRNIGTAPVAITRADVVGSAADSWAITADACADLTLPVGEACTFVAEVHPQTFGELPAMAVVISDAFVPSTASARLRATGLTATTITINTGDRQPIAGLQFPLCVVATPVVDRGIVDLWLDDVYLGRISLVDSTTDCIHVMNGVSAGVDHHAHASFYSMSGTATAGTADLVFRAADVTGTVVSLSKARTYTDDPVTITGAVTAPPSVTGGTLTLTDNTTMTVLGMVTVSPSVKSLTIKPALAAGDHYIVAEYSGAPGFGPSAAGAYLQVLPDNGVALLATTPGAVTFYPYRDGYRDTVQVGGTLDEPATATIAIYRPTGTRLVKASLGWKTGVYRYTWSGRTGTGSLLPTGKYRVVQTLRDRTGHVRTVTSYITLSRKRLYTYTTYLNKSIDQAAANTNSWIGWQFRMPSATVYKKITFQAYGRSRVFGGLHLGGVDFRECPLANGWGPGCVSSWGGIGLSNGWYSKGLSTSYNRSGRYVRGIVSASGSGVIYKARLKVVYAILK